MLGALALEVDDASRIGRVNLGLVDVGDERRRRRAGRQSRTCVVAHEEAGNGGGLAGAVGSVAGSAACGWCWSTSDDQTACW